MERTLIKYPRTLHLPWSNWSSDDKVMTDVSVFHGKDVVVTEKMDGENFTGYKDYAHARSLEPLVGEDRGIAKNIWFNVAHMIPDGYRFCGENMYAKHSIHYLNLDSYLLFFSIWNEHNVCLSWDDTEYFLSSLGLLSVPVLYRGVWNEDIVKKFDVDEENREGYVVRLADSFNFQDFKTSVAKFVRKDHVQTSSHWRTQKIVPNQLSD